MAKLPKPKKMSFAMALTYIAKSLNITIDDMLRDTLHRALCEGDIIAEGQYDPATTTKSLATAPYRIIPAITWGQYHLNGFKSIIAGLQSIQEDYIKGAFSPRYYNPTIAADQLDEWLSTSVGHEDADVIQGSIQKDVDTFGPKTDAERMFPIFQAYEENLKNINRRKENGEIVKGKPSDVAAQIVFNEYKNILAIRPKFGGKAITKPSTIKKKYSDYKKSIAPHTTSK